MKVSLRLWWRKSVTRKLDDSSFLTTLHWQQLKRGTEFWLDDVLKSTDDSAWEVKYHLQDFNLSVQENCHSDWLLQDLRCPLSRPESEPHEKCLQCLHKQDFTTNTRTFCVTLVRRNEIELVELVSYIIVCRQNKNCVCIFSYIDITFIIVH